MNKIHPLSDVQTSNIGVDTYVWQYSIILKGAHIGSNCNINCHVFIENDVIIGNNVEIGASTTVDCGTLEPTIIQDGVIIDNLVQVAHNVEIGSNTAIAACSSGTTSSSPPPTLSITQVTAPVESSAPAQLLAAGMGTGSVFVNSTTGSNDWYGV